MTVGYQYRGKASQRPSHYKEVLPETVVLYYFLESVKDQVAVRYHARYCWRAVTRSISAVTSYEQVDSSIIEKVCTFVIIVDNRPVAMKIEQGGTTSVLGIVSTSNSNPSLNFYEMVPCIGSKWLWLAFSRVEN